MAYGDFKDFNRRTIADKLLRDKAFNISKNPKYGRYQCGLSEWFINFLIKKLLVEQITMKSLLTLAEELADELQKGFRFSLCVIDIYSKSACVVLMKDK